MQQRRQAQHNAPQGRNVIKYTKKGYKNLAIHNASVATSWNRNAFILVLAAVAVGAIFYPFGLIGTGVLLLGAYGCRRKANAANHRAVGHAMMAYSLSTSETETEGETAKKRSRAASFSYKVNASQTQQKIVQTKTETTGHSPTQLRTAQTIFSPRANGSQLGVALDQTNTPAVRRRKSC